MTVKEPIRELQQLDPDTLIIVRGYEDGYNNILRLILRKIIPHPERKADYYGEYASATNEEEEKAAIRAVELYGENTKAEG